LSNHLHLMRGEKPPLSHTSYDMVHKYGDSLQRTCCLFHFNFVVFSLFLPVCKSLGQNCRTLCNHFIQREWLTQNHQRTRSSLGVLLLCFPSHNIEHLNILRMSNTHSLFMINVEEVSVWFFDNL
jgi:hypothetical protein